MQTQGTIRCICEILHLFCIHNLYYCSCRICKKAAAPARVSSFGRITSRQLSAIMNLAHAKQRSLPSNLSSWSVSFASGYIKFLASLPFPREILPRLEQFSLEHRQGRDYFAATHTKKFGEYTWADGMTRPITQAIVAGDSQDLVDGVVKTEVHNE